MRLVLSHIHRLQWLWHWVLPEFEQHLENDGLQKTTFFHRGPFFRLQMLNHLSQPSSSSGGERGERGEPPLQFRFRLWYERVKGRRQPSFGVCPWVLVKKSLLYFLICSSVFRTTIKGLRRLFPSKAKRWECTSWTLPFQHPTTIRSRTSCPGWEMLRKGFQVSPRWWREEVGM